MERPFGSITKTGWLYQGNYAEWKERMDAVESLTSFEDVPPEDRDKRRCHLLSMYVTPAILERIPDRCRSNVSRLRAKLKSHARPFPFPILTAEIRARVYMCLFVELEDDEEDEWDVTISGKLEAVNRCKSPSILKVSRNTRREALPAFISRSTFYINRTNVSNDKVAATLYQWATKGLKSSTEHLRDPQVGMGFFPRRR
ncbi:hypothetical protein B0A55_06222 [Friedmanniomyces simplex]|uniref:Uncharacterized protein n=1 Tax=Friedmanniomyces simplex TaxID=329884 RepID=A0A4U0X5U3_9PEZI|nr:hypothetical protein B0A55_06222 [Friedmanniomyces simplex]